MACSRRVLAVGNVAGDASPTLQPDRGVAGVESRKDSRAHRALMDVGQFE